MENTPVRIRGLESAGFVYKGLVAFTHEKPVKQRRTPWSFPHRGLHLSFSCRKIFANKFNERNEKMQSKRKAVKPEKIIIVSSVSIVKDL